MALGNQREFGNGNHPVNEEDDEGTVRLPLHKVITAITDSALVLSGRMTTLETERKADRRLLEAVVSNVESLTKHQGLPVTRPVTSSVPPMREKYISVTELPDAMVEAENVIAGRKMRAWKGRVEGAIFAIICTTATVWLESRLHLVTAPPAHEAPTHESKP